MMWPIVRISRNLACELDEFLRTARGHIEACCARVQSKLPTCGASLPCSRVAALCPWAQHVER